MVLFLVAFYVATVPAGLLMALVGERLLATWVPGELFLGLVCLGVTSLVLKAEQRSLQDVGLRVDRRGCRDFGLGAGLGILILVLAALIALGFGGFHWVRHPGGGVAVLQGLWIYLAVSFYEELLYRGYPFQRLMEGVGTWPGLILGALVFAWAHMNNPNLVGGARFWAFLNISLAGLLLGLAWLRTRSLALPMGLHLGWNWAQGSLLGFGVSGTEATGWLEVVFHDKPDWLTGKAFGLEASLPCAIVCSLAILGFLLWKPKVDQASREA